MITRFKLSQDCKTVSWQHEGQTITLTFQKSVTAYHVEHLDEVLVQANVNDFWKENLIIYYADGTVKARPAMPVVKHEVHGVYSVWFEQGKKQVTVVLHSDEFSPYDTACIFDLETHKFSKFHPTK